MAEPLAVRLAAGTQGDLWAGFNVTGQVHLLVRSRTGENRINVWWITWGVGSVHNLGQQSGSVRLTIPINWWKGIVSAKLRASAVVDTVVYVSDTAEVDYKKTFQW
jgi:hypothetical protein